MALKIYTGGGDQGNTSLLNGKRVSKDDLRIETSGVLDELQSSLGMARSLMEKRDFAELIYEVQNDIYIASTELSCEGEEGLLKNRLDEIAIHRIEKWIDRYTSIYSLTGQFVVPGASRRSAALHVARTMCRRVERRIVGVNNREQSNYDLLLVYFNRLSDLLFILAWGMELESIIKEAVLRVISLEEQ